MQKKSLVVLALAGLLAAESVTAYAAPSISTDPVIVDVNTNRGGGGGRRGGGSTGPVKVINLTTSAQNGLQAGPGGVTIQDPNTPLGAWTPTAAEEIQMMAGAQTNEKGETIVGNVAVGFVQGENATAGLPETVVNSMNNINSGQPLDQALGTTSLTGYNALTGTHVISVTDAATGTAAFGNVQVSLYVPNLVDGLNNVSILYYNNATGTWSLILVNAIDLANKTVTVGVPGSGVLSVVYQRQAAGTQAAQQ